MNRSLLQMTAGLATGYLLSVLLWRKAAAAAANGHGHDPADADCPGSAAGCGQRLVAR